LALASRGCHVVIAAKTVQAHPTLPGTIYTVCSEIESKYPNVQALPVVVDLRSADACVKAVEETVKHFGRVDVLVNNASALWWQNMIDTPTSKYDLINGINARGAFIMTRECMKHMLKNKWGRVVSMGPPLPKSYTEYAGKTAYYMSKCGMSMVALGAAAEGEGSNITGNALWPATIIESLAATNFKLGERDTWRKASILADCVVQLCGDARTTGETLIDDLYLAKLGMSQREIRETYNLDPSKEVPRFLAPSADGKTSGGDWKIKRGDVKKLKKDLEVSARL
jgi:NAD(P)-dependent dehydrogenase (short-subunit alcohol dehydrogenase family)